MYSAAYEYSFHTLSCLLSIILCTADIVRASVIHGKYTENIKHYHLAIPHKATADGEFSSFHLPHFHDYDAKQFGKRRKREIDDPDAVHYGISVNDELHHIEMWPNRDFLHPQAIIERRDPTLPVHKRDVRGVQDKKMCYYLGRVRGSDDSKAALSTCDGLAGYIQIGNKMYFIEPVHEHSPNVQGHHLHVVYQPDTGAAEHFCGTENTMENWERNIKNRMREEYVRGQNFYKRDTGGTFEIVPKWMEILIVCDKNMIDKHKGRRDILEWVLCLFNMVKSLYADATLAGVLVPVVVRIVMLEKEEDEIDLNIVENVQQTLRNFCNWVNDHMQTGDDTHPNHFDVALLLSDWDFCDAPGDCSTHGLAYVSGACSNRSNCQLIEDKGLLTGIVITHEQGHLLGMLHDSQSPTPCPAKHTDGSDFVMSPYAHLFTLRWSSCSSAYMMQLAEAHLLDCFNDEPTNEEYPMTGLLPGVVYGPTEQCNMLFRDKDKLGSCVDIEEREWDCSMLPCIRPPENKCLQFNTIIADGTPCAVNKWCFKTKCEEKGTRPAAIDGGWGDWGDWTACSRSCGRGAQSQERLCDNPKPENGGKYCVGMAKKYRVCNAQECPLDTPSFRDQRCKDLFPMSDLVQNDNRYKPEDLTGFAFDEEAPCSLSCVVKGTTLVSVSTVIDDGAKCEIGNPWKMCIAGICHEVPCDGKFEGSTAVLDQCEVCNGDGTMCKKVEGNDSKGITEYHMVAVVPVGAKKVKIWEAEPNPNILALGLPDNKTVYYNGDYSMDWPGIYELGKKGRSFFVYTRTEVNDTANLESFVWDFTREEIGIYIGHVSTMYKFTVKWSWIEPSDSPTRQPKYTWEIAEYKECSANCEGGIQETVISCIEEVGGKVADSFCEGLEKPKADSKKCNEKPCETEWKVGIWGPCRACKKKGGVRVRQVECVKMNPKKVGDCIISEDSACKAPKPGTVELCETKQKCGSRKRKSSYVPAKFQETIWQQMNKLHLTKRGVKPKVYLKGHAPTTGKCTTDLTWTPPPLQKLGTPHVQVDNEYAEQLGNPIQIELKTINVNQSDSENQMLNKNTQVVRGMTFTVKPEPLPKRYNKTILEERRKKFNATRKPHHRI